MGMRVTKNWLVGASLAALTLALGGSLSAQEPVAPPSQSEAIALESFVLPPPPEAIARFDDVVAPLAAVVDPESLILPAPPEAVVRVDDIAPATPEPVRTADASVRLDLEAPLEAIVHVEDVLPKAAPVQAAQVEPEPLNPLIKSAVETLAKADIPRGANAAALRKEREAIAAFYAARDFAPLWVASGKWTPQAAAAVARLERADDDGIVLSAYAIPTLKAGDPAALAATEIALSQAVVGYGRQASGGRIDPRSISNLITQKPETADAGRILADVSASTDANAALLAFNPPHKGYTDLRAKLAELRQERPAIAQTRIPAGPEIKVGMKDPRVPLIRAHFGLEPAQDAGSADNLLYDSRVASAVADFQRSSGIPASGALTKRTIAALSGGDPSRLEAEILANMERWRWMPRDLGDSRLEVNIPDYGLKLVRDGEVAHRTRVIVGKPTTPTPVFSNTMQFLIVNPYWNVPPSIIKKEMMPKLAADPDYLKRLGYEVVQKKGQLIVRQPPGERNALGNIKFMFPNEHAVYLHDTPSRGLFANAKRAYSHGCVRVDQPFALAEVVLGRDNGWTQDRVRRMVGGGEKTVQLPKHLPIHIEYFTAFVDDAGKMQLRDDIYGYSRKLRVAMGLEG